MIISNSKIVGVTRSISFVFFLAYYLILINPSINISHAQTKDRPTSFSKQKSANVSQFEIDINRSIAGMGKIIDSLEIKSVQSKQKTVVVFQPSHQTDTGKDYNEALTCNTIVEAAINCSSGKLNLNKVWSFNASGLHHAREGSNTKIAHTSAIVDGKISGYAYELAESNKLNPNLFVSVHNNGGTKSHACWGFVHEGDQYEEKNRELAKLLVDAICEVTGMENRGVHGDSMPGRNDYRCVSTGKRAFYSLDEHVNQAPLRVLLEIGDNKESREFLSDPDNLKTIGEIIMHVLETRFAK